MEETNQAPVAQAPATETRRPERQERSEHPMRGNRRSRKKVCSFCVDKQGSYIDYKDIAKLRKYVSERSKILPRRVTGTCTHHH